MSFVLGWPQTILLTVMFVNLGVVLAYHGRPMNTKHNFFMALFVAVLNLGLLYWGGFFS